MSDFQGGIALLNELLNCIGDFTVLLEGKEISVTGVLKKRGEDIVLECRAAANTLPLARTNDEFLAYGTVQRKEITLIRCAVIACSLISPEFDAGQIIIQPCEIVAGMSAKEPIHVSSIKTTIEELNWMFSDKAVQENCLSPENSALLNFTFPQNITAKDADDIITIGRDLHFSSENEFYTIHVCPYVSFGFQVAIPLPAAITKIASVRNLLSFFADDYLPLGNISFTTPDTNESCSLFLNYKDKAKTADKPFLISTSVFANDFQNIYHKWSNFCCENRPIVDLFYGIVTNHSKGSNRFLNLCQCIEIFSRCFRNKEANTIRKKDINNPSKIYLKHRLKDILLDTKDILGITEEQCDILAKKISDARNYYTHYDKKKISPSFQCISSANIALHFIILSEIYKLLGINQNAITNCSKWREYSALKKQVENILQ